MFLHSSGTVGFFSSFGNFVGKEIFAAQGLTTTAWILIITTSRATHKIFSSLYSLLEETIAKWHTIASRRKESARLRSMTAPARKLPSHPSRR